MKNHTLPLLCILSSLCIGLFIYTTSRADILYINQWLAPIGGFELKSFFQSLLSQIFIPQWIIYSLPDGLWMLALTLSILMIWNYRIDKKSLPWLGTAMIVGISVEVFQAVHWIKGSFDIIDLLFIMLGAILPASFSFIKFRSCKTLLDR